MAKPLKLNTHDKMEVTVRFTLPDADKMLAVAFCRYPEQEWASFARFGWRESKNSLTLTLAAIDAPSDGDLDTSVPHVAIRSPYTLRVALAAEQHPLAVSVFHSHPQDCDPRPSTIDDDMDLYFSSYFADFAPKRPYLSLIVSSIHGKITMSGRVHWHARWIPVTRFVCERNKIETYGSPPTPPSDTRRWERLTSGLGLEALTKLRSSTVAVIGLGGTGSAAVEVLARAGVGRLVVVDSDQLDYSNLERVHGSRPHHAKEKTPKARIALSHIGDIDPDCRVEAYAGSLPQSEIVDAVVRADVLLGCTDQQHGRLSLSDIALRYLVPAIDCGVALEGQDGKVTGQVIQLVRFLPSDACALCRRLTDPSRILQELLPEEERSRRRVNAPLTDPQDHRPNPYWNHLPQLNTVGYLTTIAGAMAAAYAIGWITGTFDPPFERIQMNLGAPYFDVQDITRAPRDTCICRKIMGWADQAQTESFISAPRHWPEAKRLN